MVYTYPMKETGRITKDYIVQPIGESLSVGIKTLGMVAGGINRQMDYSGIKKYTVQKTTRKIARYSPFTAELVTTVLLDKK